MKKQAAYRLRIICMSDDSVQAVEYTEHSLQAALAMASELARVWGDRYRVEWRQAADDAELGTGG